MGRWVVGGVVACLVVMLLISSRSVTRPAPTTTAAPTEPLREDAAVPPRSGPSRWAPADQPARVRVAASWFPAAVDGWVLGRDGRPAADALVACVGGGVVRYEITSEDGAFSFGRLGPGDYRFGAWGDRDAAPWVDLPFAPGEQLKGITLALEPGLAVEGDVVDAEGEPEAAASVCLSLPGATHERLCSDEGAHFRLFPLAPGTMRLRVPNVFVPDVEFLAEVGQTGLVLRPPPPPTDSEPEPSDEDERSDEVYDEDGEPILERFTWIGVVRDRKGDAAAGMRIACYGESTRTSADGSFALQCADGPIQVGDNSIRPPLSRPPPPPDTSDGESTRDAEEEDVAYLEVHL